MASDEIETGGICRRYPWFIPSQPIKRNCP